MRKKGIFFVVDSLLAISVLVVGILVILANHVSSPVTIQGSVLTNDFLEQMHNVKAREVNSPFILSERIAGEINNSLEQKVIVHLVAHYYYSGRTLNATTILNETAGRVIPRNFNMRYELDGNLIYEKLNKVLTVDDAPLVWTDKQIYLNELGGVLVGPHTSKITIW